MATDGNGNHRHQPTEWKVTHDDNHNNNSNWQTTTGEQKKWKMAPRLTIEIRHPQQAHAEEGKHSLAAVAAAVILVSRIRKAVVTISSSCS